MLQVLNYKQSDNNNVFIQLYITSNKNFDVHSIILSNKCNIMHQISCTFSKTFPGITPTDLFSAGSRIVNHSGPSPQKSWLHAYREDNREIVGCGKCE